MFNWYSAPTFVAMLFFLALASYVLTRSPRSPLTLAAVAAQVATAAYLFGQGMQANATTFAVWWPWARDLLWGATMAPVLWYWATIALLSDQASPAARQYLRAFGYPLGAALAAAALIFTVSIYAGDGLYRWHAVSRTPIAPATYYYFLVRPGAWYPAVVVYLLVSTIGAAGNLWLGRSLPIEEERRARFSWLLGSAALFILGVICLGLALQLVLSFWVIWLGHLALVAGLAVMASNVAAYSLLLDVEVLRRDLFYFLTSLGIVVVGYGAIFTLFNPGYSFRLLTLLMGTLIVTILFAALTDVGRRLLDRLFFPGPVQELRALAAGVAQGAAKVPDLSPLLVEAQAGLAEVSTAHLVRLTEDALRRLNNPAALAHCELLAHLPSTLRSGPEVTPLQQAKAIREALVAAIERLRPTDRLQSSSTGALQYLILREEYVLGLPNKQIVVRHGISESTFHRQRREAIVVLAQDLAKQEQVLADSHRAERGQSATATGTAAGATGG